MKNREDVFFFTILHAALTVDVPPSEPQLWCSTRTQFLAFRRDYRVAIKTKQPIIRQSHTLSITIPFALPSKRSVNRCSFALNTGG